MHNGFLQKLYLRLLFFWVSNSKRRIGPLLRRNFLTTGARKGANLDVKNALLSKKKGKSHGFYLVA